MQSVQVVYGSQEPVADRLGVVVAHVRVSLEEEEAVEDAAGGQGPAGSVARSERRV